MKPLLLDALVLEFATIDTILSSHGTVLKLEVIVGIVVDDEETRHDFTRDGIRVLPAQILP